jgi:REP element-mobilizing transposase RayT
MPRTLGYHFVRSGYGLWLPGDSRGHWSESYDDQIGFYEPHMLHEGDPARQRMSSERLKHPPMKLTAVMMDVVEETLDGCMRASDWTIAAASIESTHIHLAIPYTAADIHNLFKWIGQQLTKAIHQRTSHSGPVFCKNHWCQLIFDGGHWQNTIRYIEQHNVRRGLSERPYCFL